MGLYPAFLVISTVLKGLVRCENYIDLFSGMISSN